MVIIRIIRLKSSWTLHWSVVWIRKLPDLEDGGSKLFRNIGQKLLASTEQHVTFTSRVYVFIVSSPIVVDVVVLSCVWVCWGKRKFYLAEGALKGNMLTLCMFRQVILGVCCSDCSEWCVKYVYVHVLTEDHTVLRKFAKYGDAFILRT